jgi:hypothetical protein
MSNLLQKLETNTSWIYCVYNRNACSGGIVLFTWDEFIRLGKSVDDGTRPDVPELFPSMKEKIKLVMKE